MGGPISHFKGYRFDEQEVTKTIRLDACEIVVFRHCRSHLSLRGILEENSLPKMYKLIAGPSEGHLLAQSIKRANDVFSTKFWRVTTIIPVLGKGTRLIIGMDGNG